MFSKLKLQLVFGGMLVWGILKSNKSLLSALLDALREQFIVFCFSLILVSFSIQITPSHAEEIIPHVAQQLEDLVISTDMPDDPIVNKPNSFSPLFSDLSSLRLEQFSGVNATENQIGFYSGAVMGGVRFSF